MTTTNDTYLWSSSSCTSKCIYIYLRELLHGESLMSLFILIKTNILFETVAYYVLFVSLTGLFLKDCRVATRIDAVMVSVIAASAAYYWFESKSGKTKYYKIGTPCFFLKHAATESDLNLRRIKLIKQVNVIFHNYIV